MRLLTARDVADRLALKSPATVHRWTARGKLPAPVLDEPNARRWSEAQIDEWIHDRQEARADA